VTGSGKFKARDTKRAKELRNGATPAERMLWRYLSGSKLGVKFSRQMPVGPFFADFLCRQRNLIVELDGFSHDVQPQRDIYRDRYLREAGYRILHFRNAEVLSNAEGVVMAIQAALGRASSSMRSANEPPSKEKCDS
jgi:BirA family biotin operon repressor/biotin-[acetyl-CoA-carboxylase] ligase